MDKFIEFWNNAGNTWKEIVEKKKYYYGDGRNRVEGKKKSNKILERKQGSQ
jgi:hypothetical protein